MLSCKVINIGNSLGVILPKEALGHLNIDKGDTVFLMKTNEGYQLTPYDAEFELQMSAAEEVMREYRNALRELAK